MDQIVQVSEYFGPLTGFDQSILSEDADSYVQITNLGITIRRKKEAPLTYYGHIDHPVKTLWNWKLYALRFDPRSTDASSRLRTGRISSPL